MGCASSKDIITVREKSAAKEKVQDLLDIDLNDPEVQNAALKIQAGFRGLKTRKGLKDKKPEDEKENDEIADIDLTDPDLADAALKIQAGFRGHKARKTIKKIEDSELDKKIDLTSDELADIDLSDPDLNKAATKIQATFRGHKHRKDQ